MKDLTFDTSGGRRQAKLAGGHPLDGSLVFRADPHTDHEPFHNSAFLGGLLTLLHALCLASHQKTDCDTLVMAEGVVVDGKAHPALKLSAHLPATIATLSGKLRLCKSSRVRPDSAPLKHALARGSRPWQKGPASEFFDD